MVTRATFRCDACGCTFSKARPDKEAEEEAVRLFGELPAPENQRIVCADCWNTAVAKGFRPPNWQEGDPCPWSGI